MHRPLLCRNVPEVKSLLKGPCLEIGPFYAPVLIDDNVEYFDILTQEELIERAESINVQSDDISRIPYIHHTNKKGSLCEVNKKYDLVFSSHCIEHQLNFIKHLNEVYDLLNDNGFYVIICPDKRYCFDHFLSETNIAEIIEDFYINKEAHSLKSVIEHRMLTTHNDCIRHWDNDHSSVEANWSEHPLTKEQIENLHQTTASGASSDVHNYKFTPESFRETMDFLKKLEYTKLDIFEVYPTLSNNVDFTVILKKE